MNNKRKLAAFLLALLCAGSLLLSSCLRDEDKELFRHPIVVTGDINPSLGVPVANAELSVNELLDMMQIFSGIVDPNDTDEYLTIKFDTSITSHINITSSKSMGRNNRIQNADSDTTRFTETFRGLQKIDMFSNITELNQVSVRSLLVDLLTTIRIEATAQLDSLITVHHTRAYIADLSLDAYNDNNEHVSIPFSGIRYNIQPRASQDITILNDYDASQLLNIIPTKIGYTATVYIAIPTSELGAIALTDFIVDSLTIRSMDVDASLNVEFPLNMCIHNLAYGFSTPLSLGHVFDSITSDLTGDNLQLELESTKIHMKITNGLPYNINLTADILDANEHVLFSLTPTAANITGAPIAPDPNDDRLWITNGSTSSLITLEINSENMSQLGQSAFIKFNAALSTTDDSQNRSVAIRRSDKMGINLYLQVTPHASFSIPVTDSPILK